MNHISSKTFKSGNSVALRLPRALGVEPGAEMRIERDGDALIVRPAVDAAAEKAKVLRLVELMRSLPVGDEPIRRERIVFPKRRHR